MNETQLSKKAWSLSLAGLLPFAVLTFEIWSNIGFFSDIFKLSAISIFIGYSCIILSFLGGTIWSFAIMMRGRTQLAIWFLTLSVCPALVGFLALLLQPQNIAWLLLIGGFLSQLKIEHILMQLEVIPAWFWQLRMRITAIVCCLISLNFLHCLIR
jgi:Protein of unknown function (DUF3429)